MTTTMTCKINNAKVTQSPRLKGERERPGLMAYFVYILKKTSNTQLEHHIQQIQHSDWIILEYSEILWPWGQVFGNAILFLPHAWHLLWNHQSHCQLQIGEDSTTVQSETWCDKSLW